MPPPHFSAMTQGSNSSSGVGAASSGAQMSAPSLNDLPKVQRHLVRDVLQQLRASLTNDDASPSPTNRRATATYEAIRKLTSDALLQPSDETGTAQTSASGRSSKAQASHSYTGAEGEGSASAVNEVQIRRQVSSIIATALSRIFSDEMDQDSRPLAQLLVSYLYALHPILDPLCIVLEWWDVLLRPVLKNPQCNPSIARKAHILVVWAMRSTPAAAYVDEPAPSPVWPVPAQSAVAADITRVARRPGDAPYPASSTRAASQTRSSESGSEARLSTLFSTKVNRGVGGSGSNTTGNSSQSARIESLRRFTQRVFDLYTSEALSANAREIEDDDIREIAIDEPSPDESAANPLDKPNAQRRVVDTGVSEMGSRSQDLDVGPTWKGNLEAIILTFGEERPKAFFHHLSESFLDPSARIPILLLLTIFFRISSLHAYHIVNTPFVRLLILSLQLDTSNTSAALGTSALSTLIPHIPNWIANGGAGGLPALLSIMARIMDWRKLGPQWEQRSGAPDGGDGEEEEEWAQVARISRRLKLRQGIEWKRLDTTFDSVSPPPPDAEKLFTFLYGIFPCNVIRFLRAPVDYLRKAEYESPFQVDWDDIIDEMIVQNRAAPILRRHVLHPSLVDADAEGEITDKQRWREHDAADITAECVCLHIAEQIEDPSIWLESRRVSLVDNLPSLLSFRDLSNSSSVAVTAQRASFGDLEAGGTESGDFTPVRFQRRRSVSESLGRRSSIGSPLFEQSSDSRRRNLSAQPGQQAGTALASVPQTLPFSLQASVPTNDADHLLQNHVRLRYGLPAIQIVPRSQQPESLSRSSSVRSHLKTFSAARTNLTTSLMSPAQPQASDGQQKDNNVLVSPTSDGAVSPTTATDEKGPPRQRSFGEHYASPTATAGGRIVSSSAMSEQMTDSPALGGASSRQTKSQLKEEVRQSIAYLKQENLQLRNELNYEIGQKDQVLRHVGRIHRDRIKDTVLEDERQNLYQTVRMLRAQIKSIRAGLDRSKAEALSSKNRHASWENELNAKLKSFREEKKVWSNEVRQLQIIKEDHEALIAKLEAQLHDNANEVFELREQCKRDAKKVEAIHAYEDKMRRMEDCLRMWGDDVRKFDAQRRERDAMVHQYEELTMLLEAKESDRRQAERRAAAAELQSEALERQLRAAYEELERRKSLISPSATTSSEGLPPMSLLAATRRGSHTAARMAREDDEKSRLRARLEAVEAELLDCKARQEEWQLDHLVARLNQEHGNRDDDDPDDKQDRSSTVITDHDDVMPPLHLDESQAAVDGA